MDDEQLKRLGSLIRAVVVFVYSYGAVLFLLAAAVIAMTADYVKKRKGRKEDSNAKGYVPPWISIIVTLAALLLIASPIIVVSR